MNVVINGENQDIPDGVTLENLLDDLNIIPGNVVVELDGQVVHHDHFVKCQLAEDAQLEIVQFVGGG